MKEILIKALEEILVRLKSKECELTEKELDEAISLANLANKKRGLSKEQACQYLNLSRSTFDTYIRNGWLPKGQKRLGFKELSWTPCELDKSLETIKLKGICTTQDLL